MIAFEEMLLTFGNIKISDKMTQTSIHGMATKVWFVIVK